MSATAWSRLQKRYCIELLKLIFFKADTSTVRLGLTVASALFSACMLYHAAFSTGLFDRPAYALMAKGGNEWFWAVAFGLQAAGGFWRIVDPIQRDRIALVINGFGFILWFSSTICINLALGFILPTTSPEWMMIFGSGWVFFRTGFNERVTS